MFVRLFQYSKGYVRISVTGSSYGRFLNLCANHNILLWNLQARENSYEMNLSIGEFLMLRPLVKKSGTKVRIIKRYGLPFFLHHYQHRKMLFAGMLFGLLLMMYLSSFIWDIQITGNRARTDDVIFDFLEEEHIFHGIKKSKIECKELAAKIRKKFDDIIWVSVKIDGTRLFIDVQENTDLSIQDSRKYPPSDLISNVNGKVISIITRSGTPQIKEGDMVRKGQILVLGSVDIINDEGEIAASRACAADADIYVETTYYYRHTLSAKYKEKEYTGHTKKYYYIKIGRKKISFVKKDIPFTFYDSVTTEHQLHLFRNFFLPLSFGETECRSYINSDKIHTNKEIIRKSKNILSEFLLKIEEKGVQILKNNVKIEMDDKICSAEGEIRFIEKAGRRQERNFDE